MLGGTTRENSGGTSGGEYLAVLHLPKKTLAVRKENLDRFTISVLETSEYRIGLLRLAGWNRPGIYADPRGFDLAGCSLLTKGHGQKVDHLLGFRMLRS